MYALIEILSPYCTAVQCEKSFLLNLKVSRLSLENVYVILKDVKITEETEDVLQQKVFVTHI